MTSFSGVSSVSEYEEEEGGIDKEAGTSKISQVGKYAKAACSSKCVTCRYGSI